MDISQVYGHSEQPLWTQCPLLEWVTENSGNRPLLLYLHRETATEYKIEMMNVINDHIVRLSFFELPPVKWNIWLAVVITGIEVAVKLPVHRLSTIHELKPRTEGLRNAT